MCTQCDLTHRGRKKVGEGGEGGQLKSGKIFSNILWESWSPKNLSRKNLVVSIHSKNSHTKFSNEPWDTLKVSILVGKLAWWEILTGGEPASVSIASLEFQCSSKPWVPPSLLCLSFLWAPMIHPLYNNSELSAHTLCSLLTHLFLCFSTSYHGCYSLCSCSPCTRDPGFGLWWWHHCFPIWQQCHPHSHICFRHWAY